MKTKDVIPTDQMIGKPYGRLTVLERAPNNKYEHTMLKCLCSCGKVKYIPKAALTRGDTVSCGCYGREQRKKACTKHGHSKAHALTPTYYSWCCMKQRCLDENYTYYINHGGRGITICAEWLNDFKTFLKDMGERPTGHTLERRDNELGYSKENCYWATRKEQMNNTRSNQNYTFNGITKSIAGWAEHTGLKYYTIRSRLMILGWSVERALTTPAKVLSK